MHMLSLFRGLRSDHPLDGKKARVEFLADISRLSPMAAMGELAAYLDAIKTADNLTPTRALDIVAFIEKAGQSPYSLIITEFLSRPRATRFQQDRAHSIVHAYFAQLVEAYRFCLAKYQVGAVGAAKLKPYLARMICCALDAGAAQVKWSLFRRSILPRELWRELAELYQIAIALKLETTSCVTPKQTQSTPQHAFLVPLMLAVSAPDALRPTQIELAAHIIDQLAGQFRIGRTSDSSTLYSYDFAAHNPPGRLRPDKHYGTSVAYFGPGGAANGLNEMMGTIEHQGSELSELTRKMEMSTPLIQATLRHLQHQWSTEFPQRLTERRRYIEQVTVIHEFEEVVAGVGGLFFESPYVSNEEQWTVENESPTGFGACATSASGSWLTVGSLIALQRDEGSAWAAAVVRRMTNDASGNRYVGIEVLSHGGTAVTIITATLNAPGSTLPAEGALCVLLSIATANRGEATLLMRPRLFSDSQEVIMRAYDQSYLLSPLRLIEQGDEFDLARYRIEKL
jgi:hypothetical protein